MLTLEIDLTPAEASAVRYVLDGYVMDVAENAGASAHPLDVLLMEAVEGFRSASESYLGGMCGRYRVSVMAWAVIDKAFRFYLDDGDFPFPAESMAGYGTNQADILNLHARITAPTNVRLF